MVFSQTDTHSVGGGSGTVGAVVIALGSTVSGGTLIIPRNDGLMFIDPRAQNVLIGGQDDQGSMTLIGGSGNAVVFHGRGLFYGSAGTNTFSTSTVRGATTLIGGGSHSYLYANAGGDLIQAGTGVADIAGGIAASVSGNIFVTGSGQSRLYTDVAGSDTVLLGSGESIVLATGLIRVPNSGRDLFMLDKAGGNILIYDFVPGEGIFKLSSGFASASGPAPTIASSSGSGTDMLNVALSDGTHIQFRNSANFGAVYNVGSQFS